MRRLAVLGAVLLAGLSAGLSAPDMPSVREFVLGEGIPAYLWTVDSPAGDTSVFCLKEARRVMVDTVSRRIRFATKQEGVFGLYFYEKDGKYGLKTKEDVRVVPADFSEIRVLFQYVDAKKTWMLFPVFLVRRERQYALVNADGSFLTRYVPSVAQLPEAMLLTPSDRFDLYQKIPFEYWGY